MYHLLEPNLPKKRYLELLTVLPALSSWLYKAVDKEAQQATS